LGRFAHRQESVMADGKSKNSKQDRGRLSSGDHYEIRDFAHEFDISLGQVHDMIRRHGNDRATLTGGSEAEEDKPFNECLRSRLRISQKAGQRFCYVALRYWAVIKSTKSEERA
jgi:hypothetical protein